MTDSTIEKTELVINALDYANKHDLNINNKEDVRKIAEAIDPEHVSNEDIEELMKLLQATDTFMDMEAAKKETEKTNLPN